MSFPCGCCGSGLICSAPIVEWQSRSITLSKCGFNALTPGDPVARKYLKRTETLALARSDADSGSHSGLCNYSWAWNEEFATSRILSAVITIPPGAGEITTLFSASGTATADKHDEQVYGSGACGPGVAFYNRDFATTRTYSLPAGMTNPAATCGGDLPFTYTDVDTGPDGGAGLEVVVQDSEITTDTATKWVKSGSNGSETVELEDEYTTADLIARAETLIADQGWPGSGNEARRTLTSNEVQCGLTQVRFRLRLKIPNTCRATVTWKYRRYSSAGILLEESEQTVEWSREGTKAVPCYKSVPDYNPDDYETWPFVGDGDGGWIMMPIPATPGSYWTAEDFDAACTLES